MRNLLELQNITKIYKQGKNSHLILDDVSYSFPNVGFVSIVGKSGSGKSTLFNLISTLDIPSKGKILYKNKNILKFNSKNKHQYLTNEISLLFQEYNLFDEMSVLDNILLSSEIAKNNFDKTKIDAKILLKHFGLLKYKDELCKNLSGGEKQRLSLCRALINNPKIIICDEPTGALDSNNSKIVCDYLKNISKYKLVIFISHNEELVKNYSDEILEIKNKKINIIKTFKNDITQKESEVFFNKSKRFWQSKILKIFAKKHLFKNIISVIATSFSFATLIINASYFNNYESVINKETSNFICNNYGTISLAKNYEIENSNLIFKKIIRPNYKDISFLKEDSPSIIFEDNYSFLFPSYMNVNIDGINYDDIEFVPYYNPIFVHNNNLKKATSLFDIYVNDIFFEKYKNNKIVLNHINEFEINTNDIDKPIIKENININHELNVIGTLKELSFLNNPRIYYSYYLLKDYLSNYELENYSYYKKEFIYASSLVRECENDSIYSSYSLLFFIKDLNEIETMFNIIKNENYKEFSIDSYSFVITDSFTNIMDLFSMCLIAFSFALIIVSFSIQFMLNYASYKQESRTSGILSILGAKQIDIHKLFYLEQIILSIFILITSILFSLLMSFIFNIIFNFNFNINNAFNIPFLNMFGVPFLLFVLLFSLSFLFPIFIQFFVILSSKNKSIIKEIKY